jgi:hypothetical protein
VKDQKIWNISRLDSLLTEVMEEQIPGVNLPYLYFGMWRACFRSHTASSSLSDPDSLIPDPPF